MLPFPHASMTPLQARSGHNEAAKYLLTKGADITLVNEHGDTALSVAKTQSMVQILKGYGPNPRSPDHHMTSLVPCRGVDGAGTGGQEGKRGGAGGGRPDWWLPHGIEPRLPHVPTTEVVFPNRASND